MFYFLYPHAYANVPAHPFCAASACGVLCAMRDLLPHPRRFSKHHIMPRFLIILFLLLLVGPVQAQPTLQSPSEFLGYALGTQFTPHHRVMAYVDHVEAAQSNVITQSYGSTYEGRPLRVAMVSALANMNQLETIRTNNLKLTGLQEGAIEGPIRSLVWLSYNVHGNESVSTEAFLQTFYDLANPANTWTQAWLDSTVVILDPCINPDGRERYVQWYKRTRGAEMNVNPEAWEHVEPWPNGRTNHYMFDLNRDWAWQSQQETQGRIALYQQWMPHVHVDFHEQGVDAPYYFAPAAEPYHTAVTPWQREFQEIIGRNHARYFDQNNWLYFTRQVFDLLYPSYGDTWPMFNGAIGMTYEQGGSGRAGLGVITAAGDTLTLKDRIDHHHTTGLSTVEATALNTRRVLDAFKAYYDQAQQNPAGPYKTFVIKHTNAPDKQAALKALLDRQLIRYGHAPDTRTLRGFVYKNAALEQVTVEPQDVLISVYQPKSVLARVLFEPQAELADSLTYDITAWALPYAYGLEAYALTTRIDPVQGPTTAPAPDTTTVATPYAYLAPWESLQDLRFLAAVLKAKVKVRSAEKAFTLGGTKYTPGTLIITRTDNAALGDRFDALVRTQAEATGQTLTPVATGLVSSGADFGSRNVRFVKAPRVGVLSGDPLFSYAVGEVWHYFDQQIGYPVSLLNADRFSSLKLYEYDALVLPNGRYSTVLKDADLTRLKDWIRAGGRLIALEEAVQFLAGKEGFSIKVKEEKKPGEKDAAPKAEVPIKAYGDRSRDAAARSIPGSIYAVTLDASHPLGFGYTSPYYTLKRSSRTYAYLKNGWNVGVLQDGAYRSGFTGNQVKQKLSNSLVFGVQSLGRGRIVYMVDNPLFRAFWHNGKLLFGNAVFLVGQ